MSPKTLYHCQHQPFAPETRYNVTEKLVSPSKKNRPDTPRLLKALQLTALQHLSLNHGHFYCAGA